MSIPQTPSPLSNILAAKTYNAAWFSGATKEAQITAAIAAAVTDGALYVYVPANMLPYNAGAVTFNNTVRMIREGGNPSVVDVQAYGAAGDNVTDDSIAFQSAMNTGNDVFIPRATHLVVTGFTFTADTQMLYGRGAGSAIRYTGASVVIALNGKKQCVCQDFSIYSLTATIGIDTSQVNSVFSHWFKIKNVTINGSSVGSLIAGVISGFTIAGIQVSAAYYGEITGCDVSYCVVGIYGLNQCNANSISKNSVRQCLRGIYLTDLTVNSDGCKVTDNDIESAQLGTISGIEFAGIDASVILANRIEITVGTPALAIYVHGGVGQSRSCQINYNFCASGIIKLGDGIGGQAVWSAVCEYNSVLTSDGSNNAIIINSECVYTTVSVHRRALGDGIFTISDLSTTTALTFADDQTFTVTLATGATTTPTIAWKYKIANSIVTVWTQSLFAAASGNSITITGLPQITWPKNNTQVMLAVVYNNSVQVIGLASIATTGVITLFASLASGAFAGTANQGFIQCMLVYTRN